MKNITIRNIFLIIFLCGFSACDDFLDLEPETSLSTAIAFDNIEGIEAGVNGIYSTIQADWVERQVIFAECLASNVKGVNAISNSNYQAALRHQSWIDLFNIANYLWQMSYKSIDITNQILEALPEIESGSNTQINEHKTRMEGEVLFLRGMLYFVLNRYYAQPQNGLSVPILTAPFSPGDTPSRASIDDVKAQVLADLKAAESLMVGIENNNNRANIWTVKALLARVYFEYKDYPMAESYADEVIESGKFSLIDGEVESAYSTIISTENVFTFLSQSNDRAAGTLYDIFSLESSNVQLSVSDDYWNLISQDPNDLRTSVLYEDLGGGVACHKYNERDMHVAYIRLPEIYLIRAESRVNNNDLEGGLADLNRLRQRAGLTDTAYDDQADLLAKIYLDRSIELSMEGDNFHNLKRLEQPIGGYEWSAAQYKLVFFIPEKEIQLNSNLIQNDTW
jgi:tetratricopeptide (TPR) repeat protein